MSAIDEVARLQTEWSATADKLKRSFQAGRWTNLGLVCIAALLAAVASQLESTPRLVLAMLSAAMFGVVTLLTARLVTAANAQAWVRARAASEALKRIAYTYAAAAAPYNNPATRDAKLKDASGQIQRQVEDLLGKRASTPSTVKPIPVQKPLDYIERRAAAAATYYEKRANEYSSVVRRLRQIEFILALFTTVITAAAGVLGKDVARAAGNFDFVAITAVLTTISGAILAHVEASRYDFLIMTFRATALRLRDALAGDPEKLDPTSAAWSDFVQACEDMIATENGSWAMKMAKL